MLKERNEGKNEFIFKAQPSPIKCIHALGKKHQFWKFLKCKIKRSEILNEIELFEYIFYLNIL